MKRYGLYAGAVAMLVLLLWFATRGGMKADPRYSISPSDVDCVQISQIGGARTSSGVLTVWVYDRRDIERLTETLNTLIAENGVSMGDDKIQLGRHSYRLEWYAPDQGGRLATVEISATGKVYREKYCFNYIGGDVFDMDYLAALLLANRTDGEGAAQ